MRAEIARLGGRQGFDAIPDAPTAHRDAAESASKTKTRPKAALFGWEAGIRTRSEACF